MKKLEKLLNAAESEGCKALGVDVDGSICGGIFALTIGNGFLDREYSEMARNLNSLQFGGFAGSLRNYLVGSLGFLNVQASGLFNRCHETMTRKLKKEFEYLGKIGADRKFAYEMAQEHLEDKELDGVELLIKSCKERKWPVFALSNGCDIGVDIVRRKYEMDGTVSNPVIYNLNGKKISASSIVYRSNGKWIGELDVGNENPKISSINIAMKDGEDKRNLAKELLRYNDLKMREMIYVGNDEFDHPLMRVSGFSVASPLAKKDTRVLADYSIKCYLD